MRVLPLLALTLALASCVAPTAPPARPAPTPTAAPAPRPAPPAPSTPAPLGVDWRDWPVTPGDWVYRQDGRGSIALYGVPGADAQLALRCDRDRAMLYLSRQGSAAGAVPMTIRTSAMARTVSSAPTGATPAYVAAGIAPRDALLDAIGFSRGRFIVEQPGFPTLVVPSWPEIERVTEDCRR